MNMRRIYIVTYDISDPKRLRRVFKTMKGFGVHLQLSVFQCDLPEIDLVRMRSALATVISATEDKVLIFDLGPTENSPIRRVIALGQPVRIFKREPRVI